MVRSVDLPSQVTAEAARFRAPKPPAGEQPVQPTPPVKEPAPEQVQNVRAKLQADVDQMLAQKAHLEQGLQKGWAIRLDKLMVDFEGELTRLNKALANLDTPEGRLVARNILEEQACENLWKSEQEITKQSLQNADEFRRQGAELDRMQQAQRVQISNEVSGRPEADIQSAWNNLQKRYIQAEIQKSLPELSLPQSDLTPQQRLEIIHAESTRHQRLLKLLSPVELINKVMPHITSDHDKQVAFQYMKQLAGQQWRQKYKGIEELRTGLTNNSAYLDSLITDLGHTPLTRSQKMEVAREKKLHEMTPDEIYQDAMSRAKGNANLAELHLVASHVDLVNEKVQIDTLMSVAQKQGHYKAIACLRRRQVRNELLRKRVETAHQAQLNENNRFGSIQALSDAQRQIAATDAKMTVYGKSIDELKTPPPQLPAAGAKPQTATPPVAAREVQSVQKQVKLKTPDGFENLVQEGAIGAWMPHNARWINVATINAFQEIGIQTPFGGSDIVMGMPEARRPDNLAPQHLVWMEYRSIVYENGTFVEKRLAVENYQHLQNLLAEYKKAFPDRNPFNFRVNIARQLQGLREGEHLTPDYLAKHPEVLQAIAQDFLRYMPSGSEQLLQGVQLVI